MTREMEAYWETKKRIERKLLLGVWALLGIIWTTACSEAPTGPYTELSVVPPTPPPTAPAEPPRNDEFLCGDVQISQKVCDKGRGPDEIADAE